MPATTAAVERSFSCYSNIHSAKRNRLSNDRASKLVYVSLNLELLAQTKRNHANKIIHTELEKTSDNAQTYAATSIGVDSSSVEASAISMFLHTSDEVIDLDSSHSVDNDI